MLTILAAIFIGIPLALFTMFVIAWVGSVALTLLICALEILHTGNLKSAKKILGDD